MKKFLSIFFVFYAVPALAAYVHPMDKMLNAWIGHPAKEVVKVWGNPTDITYERGQTKYQWDEVSSVFIPGTQFKKKVECNRILITDISHKVVYGKFKGEGCPFTEEGVAEKYPFPKN